MKSFIRQGIIIIALSLCGFCPPVRAGAQSPTAAAGALRVKTDVTGVQVILDDKEVGNTPLTLRSLAAGPHRLILVKEGYEDDLQQIEIIAEKTAVVFVVMKPLRRPMPELPVEFKVMHQHKLGYCVGTLTVSADALDFKAEQEEDRFHIPIQTALRFSFLQELEAEDRFHIPIQTLKSVSRSWGPIPGMAPGGVNASTDMMAFRIEAPGRSYGFLAYKEQIGEAMKVVSEKTKELFELVYKLWTATLKSKEK